MFEILNNLREASKERIDAAKSPNYFSDGESNYSEISEKFSFHLKKKSRHCFTHTIALTRELLTLQWI